jgi:pilus assembly protein CpaE
VPVVLGDTERDADRFRFTVADDVAVVETAAKLDQYLENHPDEDLVIIGPEVTMAVACEVAETYRLRRPFLGVVLMRRRMEVSTMSEALRAGIREVVLADDVEGLVGACKRSMAVSEQLRNVELGGTAARRGRIILVFSSKGGCGKTTVATNLAAALSSGPDGASV